MTDHFLNGQSPEWQQKERSGECKCIETSLGGTCLELHTTATGIFGGFVGHVLRTANYSDHKSFRQDTHCTWGIKSSIPYPGMSAQPRLENSRTYPTWIDGGAEKRPMESWSFRRGSGIANKSSSCPDLLVCHGTSNCSEDVFFVGS
jgi:hypothetical protein